jgi:hypothetical protein
MVPHLACLSYTRVFLPSIPITRSLEVDNLQKFQTKGRESFTRCNKGDFNYFLCFQI